MRMGGAALCLGVALLAARPAATQQNLVVRVDLVRIPVTVTDGRGRHVPGLTAADFEVLEDGQRQELEAFDEAISALSAVMLLDTSGSMGGELPVVQDAAREFIRQMRDRDELQLTEFNTFVKTLQPFTSDRAALERAVSTLSVSGATTLLNAMYDGLQAINRKRRQDDERRTAVILLSDGDDTASFATADMVTTLAKRVQVPIYAVRLLEPERDDGRNRDRALIERESPGALLLRRLANDTGGRFVFARARDLKRFYAEVADELHAQYRLGYVSTNPAIDGRWRVNSLRVKNRDNLRLRYRAGYYATRRG